MPGPSLSADKAAESTFLAEDISCIQCEYNLRGLMPKGRCPECGRDIASSLAEHAKWKELTQSLGPARRGLWLLVASQGAWLAAVPLMIWRLLWLRHQSDWPLLTMLHVCGNRPWTMAGCMEAHQVSLMWIVPVGVVSLVLQGAGGWLATEPTLPGEGQGRPRGSRLALRITLLAGPLLLIIVAAILPLASFADHAWEAFMAALLAIDLPLPLLMAYRFNELAYRLGRSSLGWKLAISGCGIAGANILSAVHVAAYLAKEITVTYPCLVAGIFGLAVFNLFWLGCVGMLARSMRPRRRSAEAAENRASPAEK